jgi:DNA recombination protein RmuC
LNPKHKIWIQEFENIKELLRNEKTQHEITRNREQMLLTNHAKQEQTLNQQTTQNTQLIAELAALKNEHSNTLEKINSQKIDLEQFHIQFIEQFTNLAQSILEEKSIKFTQQNKEQIGEIIKPLNEKIKEFEKKVEDTYIQSLKDQTNLQAEIKKLFDLNTKISTDANNLTKALKGDVKMQGNWGEVILERILEGSGLVNGREYETQKSMNNTSGKKYQPDVVIYLPDNKHVIVDAKISLIAYEKYINAPDDEKELHLKNHLASIKQHIKNLSDKNYYNLDGLNTPEYVLMFVPIESSFSLAVQTDMELFNYGWSKHIVLVSPSTLTATLLTIASIWRQENQTKNALEIAKKSGALYDKIIGFLSEYLELGKKIKQSQLVYDNSLNKLQLGRGNVISRIEELKTLGAKASKQLPDELKIPLE